jgi:hypothetical protein
VKCKKCGVERDRGIQDTIPLCHNCYLEIAEKGGNPDEENAIGVYLDDSLICVPCSTTGEGERVTAQALPDGFTCDNCLEVVNV